MPVARSRFHILTEQPTFGRSLRTLLIGARANAVGAALQSSSDVPGAVFLAAYRAQHGQCHPHGRGDGLRAAPRRATRLRTLRTQAAEGRAGLPRPRLGDRAPRSGDRVECLGADAGVRVHGARDCVVRGHRLPTGRRVDVRPRAHRAGRRDASRPAHHVDGAHSDAAGQTLAEPLERRRRRRVRGVAPARLR